MEDLVIRVRKNKQAAERWRTTQVLVVDEVSMLGPTLFEKLEGVARKIRKCDKFFGGITLVLSGDFFQLPPVDEPTFLFQSPVFRCGIQRVIDLQTIYRQKDDQTWYGVLQNIRKGQLSDTDISLLQSRLLSDPVKNVPATVLYPVNRKVDSLNDAALQRLGKPVRELKVRVARGNLAKLSDVEPMRQRMGVPSVLHLAEGAHVILTWNLDVEAGLVNGSQGIVRGFSARGYPIVDFRKVGEM
jgi:ATP-dependent DNA helicase PIF1